MQIELMRNLKVTRSVPGRLVKCHLAYSLFLLQQVALDAALCARDGVLHTFLSRHRTYTGLDLLIALSLTFVN